jgi:hypothetical protein
MSYKSPINRFHMWLDRLIVVDDEISSSFSLDDEGNNAVIRGRQVERSCFFGSTAR